MCSVFGLFLCFWGTYCLPPQVYWIRFRWILQHPLDRTKEIHCTALYLHRWRLKSKRVMNMNIICFVLSVQYEFFFLNGDNFNNNILFISKLDLNVRKKLVKCYVWSTALYGTENWTLQKVDKKWLESHERPAGPIEWKMKYYEESGRRGIFFV
jgi:hypothetical protein